MKPLRVELCGGPWLAPPFLTFMGLLRAPSLSTPLCRLSSELQTLKQKLNAVQSRLKASVEDPLRPGQQGNWGGPDLQH